VANLLIVFEEAGVEGFAPTIAFAPPGSTDVWLDELKTNFPHIRIKSFLAASSSNQKKNTGTDFYGSARDLALYIRTLPIDNEETGNVMVVTSYNTAAKRFLRHWWFSPDGTRYPISRLTKQECKEADIPLEQFQAMLDEGCRLRDSGFGYAMYQIRVPPGLFGLGIWDEVHRLKNMWTQQMQTLLQLKQRRVLLLTASPCMRRLMDLSSILEIVSQTAEAQIMEFKKDGQRSIADYVQLHELLNQNGGSYLRVPDKLKPQIASLLQPGPYGELMKTQDAVPAVVRKVVPAVLSVIALRRVTGQFIKAEGKEHTIAGNIPPYHCTVVELEPDDFEYGQYWPLHVEKLGEPDQIRVEASVHAAPLQPVKGISQAPPVESDTEIRENMDKRRRLQTSTNNTGLDKFNSYHVPSKAKDVQKW